MNRSVLLSLISIFAVLALVGGVTFALFSSQATNSGNTFGAGTLTLTVNGTAIFSGLPPMKPGENSSVQTITLSNTGSINAGSLVISSLTITGPSDANLPPKVQLTIWDDTTANNTYDVGEPLYANHIPLDSSSWTNLPLTGLSIPALGTHDIKAFLTFDSTAGDNLQGDTLSFDIAFQANQ